MNEDSKIEESPETANISNSTLNGLLCDIEGEPLEPYFDGGYWRLPYLMNGAGGYGGSVGEMKHKTKDGVIAMYIDYHT
jgi:hypothetical protein